MYRSFVPCTLALALSAQLCAQTEFIGFTYNVSVGATSRGSLVNAAGEVMTRIDGSDYKGWGTNTPGFRTISSLFFVAQDQLAQPVAGTFAINLYPEDPANPGMPLLSGVVPFATGVTGPTGVAPGSIAAIVKTVTPATPVAVPIMGGGDIFVSFALGAVTATESMSIQIVIGYQPNASFLVYDLPGPVQAPIIVPPAPPTPTTVANTRGVTLLGTSLILNARRHHFLDVGQTTAAAGTAMTITNQTSYTASNSPPPAGFGPAPGTGDFLSGVAPDIGGANVGRADNITFDFYKTGMGTGRPVFFLMDLSGGFAPAELPITTFAPGTGVVCINPTAGVILLGFTAADEAFVTTTIPNHLRLVLGGLVVVQQAAAIDATNNIVMSTCAAQRF